MSVDRTSIAWTDSTWGPTRGCSRVSAGCTNCYAERLAARFSDPGQPYHDLARRTPNGPRWTGKVQLVVDALEQPLHWKRPRRVFVDSMSDLFHESLPDDAIDRVFAVMAQAQRHTFQILTKRPERMLAYLADTSTYGNGGPSDMAWPLSNVWAGCSVEDQETANARIPLLLRTPAAVRWASLEPLLGPVDLRDVAPVDDYYTDALETLDPSRRLSWVVVGGESGPGARPMHPEWVRAVRDQCVAAKVPFFFKQWGEHSPVPKLPGGVGCMVRAGDQIVTLDGRRAPIRADLTCDLEAQGVAMRRVGVKQAGRLLDGREWSEFPS